MKARLASYKNGKIQLAFPVAEALTGIGRSPENMVQLEGSEISKHHAAIRNTPAGWVIEDLGSRNGVLVNETRVPRAIIKHGDKILIGSEEFIFETEFDAHWVPDHVIDFSTVAGAKTIQHSPVPPQSDEPKSKN